MPSPDIWSRNRVILSHLNSFSAALVFVQWEYTLLLPQALPETGWEMRAPPAVDPRYLGAPVRDAVIRRYGFDASRLVRVPQFDEWLRTGEGPLRIHLLRFMTNDPPAQEIGRHGGQFRHLTALRGADSRELALLRRVFDIVIGGEGGEARE